MIGMVEVEGIGPLFGGGQDPVLSNEVYLINRSMVSSNSF